MGLTYVTARGHDVLAPDHTAPDLTAELVQLAQAAGRQVVVYTPNTRVALQSAHDKGVDGLISDRPACLLQMLGRRVPPRVAVAGDVSACET